VEAKGLIKALLISDPVKRISAAQALEHGWFKHEDTFMPSIKRIKIDIFKVIRRRRMKKYYLNCNH
jgi:serine/threonine protein kinase